MGHFQYRARNADGQLLQGQMEALSADAVADHLQTGGVIPLSITEVAAPLKKGLKKGLVFGRQRVGRDGLILFCRQMYTLTRAGVPLVRALKGLVQTSRNQLMAETLDRVVDNLEAGQDLAGSLSRHPKVFSPIICQMVQVGEHSGKLEQAFLELSGYLEREKDTVNRIKTALRYPSFVVVAIMGAIIFISLFVIPAFEKIFSSFGGQLPLPTRILMGVSSFMLDWWPALLIGSILLAFAFSRLIKTHAGRYRWDHFKLKMPLVGDIVLRTLLIRFSHAFTMGVTSGVPLVQALSFTAQAIDNSYVGKRIAKMCASIERGDTLTNSAAQTEMFTPLVLQMLAVGEETGSVDTMLNDVADYYEREVDYDIKLLSSTIEPILIVVIGAMVLVLALGVFLPMWNLGTLARR
jgi:MSHA biogenesis protein MshG